MTFIYFMMLKRASNIIKLCINAVGQNGHMTPVIRFGNRWINFTLFLHVYPMFSISFGFVLTDL